ncbi:MAG: class I SAM-dependent methyltransferase [Elusimicrobia bacterium]|nr:class I SAM-dependent methyltransferase [Elusimicrobiota bacterium]
MNKMATDLRCELCAEGNPTVIQEGVRHDAARRVMRCRSCGLVFLDPLPTEDELAKFYSEHYRDEHEPGVPPAQAYRQELPEARRRVERLKTLLAPELSLLEIGASSGAFLDAARPFLGGVTGVEPSHRHRAWASAELRLAMVDALDALGEQRYDRIVLFHVLEHVRHPVAFLRGLLGRLKPGGRVVVEVPSVDDALIALYRLPAYAPFYYQDAHLWYFSPQTLGQAARQAGARPEISGVQRYDLSNHLRWMLTGKPGGLGFYGRLFPGSLDQAYGEALVRAGHADTLWAVLENGS